MADQAKINTERLNEYVKLLGELWKITEKITKLFNGMTVQEKTLSGGVLVQSQNPWDENKMSVFVGGAEIVRALIDQAIIEVKRPLPEAKPPVFEKKDKDKLPN